MFVVGGVKTGELEHEQADVFAERPARFQERIGEQTGIEKMFVGFAGAGTVAR
jgi:hypothetical protein